MHDFLHDDSGATAVEYSLLISLIAAVLVVSLIIIGSELSERFEVIHSSVTAAS